MNKIIAIICITVFLGVQQDAAHALQFNTFDQDSYQYILKSNSKRPFLLVFWSVDCPPCYEELRSLGNYLETHPEFKLILVSTDSTTDSETIEQLLIEVRLQNQELWIFSSAPPEQLRYSIDPHWYGELPRSYFFDRCQQRTALSGKFDIGKILTRLGLSSCQ